MYRMDARPVVESNAVRVTGLARHQRCDHLQVAVRYGGMKISDARKLKSLEDETRKLKKLLAESMLDASKLKEMLGKYF
jgi:hypothetical protein